jgi:hypothetical protein
MSEADGKKWYLHVAGRPEGPYAAAEAVARANQAGLGLNAPVWLPGWSDWSTLGAVPDLQDLSRALGSSVQLQPSIGDATSVRLGVPGLPGSGRLPGGPTPLPAVQPVSGGGSRLKTLFKILVVLLIAMAAFLLWLFPELIRQLAR